MDRLQLFPLTTCAEATRLTIGGCDLLSLAETHSTPLYVYDKATLDFAARDYRSHLQAYYPAPASITYAGKAALNTGLAQWTQSQGLNVDCTGLGEILIAVTAGVPRERIVIHGVNKSLADLLAAIEYAGTIVVDNLSELRRLAELAQTYTLPALWLRFQPGMAVDTHAYTQTGHTDSKFGLGWDDALRALQFCRENGLDIQGIHFHQGSQFRDPEPLAHGIERALDLAAQALHPQAGWHFSPGGGWGVAYHEDDLPHPSVEQYVRFISEWVVSGCQRRGLPLPHLHLEPGRSLVARAGVALYQVGAIKRTEHLTWLLIDGGMADNPRHALYGARYTALPVKDPARPFSQTVSIAGPYCESGDVIIEGLPFADVQEGEIIALPMAGAYHLSMASNYNGARRPAALLLDNGQVHSLQRRETAQDLLQRDL